VITRRLSKALASSKKSLLLLGPRQTGKSTLIGSLKPDLTINLAHEPTFLEFLRAPSELEQRLAVLNKPSTIFIDEVQRLPSLLNTLQALLDDHGNRHRFYLTGSSARKLKRGHANLLPGRIHVYHLTPLSCSELEFSLDTRKALAFGTLPGIWSEADDATRKKTLRSYAATYLKEEVQAENLTRNLEGFARFLDVAAAASGQFLDLTKLSSLAQVPRQSTARFFEILEDCLLVRRIDAFSHSAAKRLIQHPRYLLFDGGVLNGLLGNFTVSADRIGSLFEQLVINQIFNEAAAADIDVRLSTYRTEHGAEVDLIVEEASRVTAIEIKASASLDSSAFRGLQNFREFYRKPHQSFVFYNGSHRKKAREIEIWPWQDGIRDLFRPMDR